MKNSKLRRVLTLMACAVLLVCLSVGATLAYLADNTEVVTNTFVAGEGINIDLDEGDVYEEDEDGATVTTLGKHKPDFKTNRVPANNYKLVPGYAYDKDPIVHVIKNSGDCYVFVKVVNNLADIEDPDVDDIAAQMAANGWKQLVVEGEPVTDVFYYESIVTTDKENDQHLPVFETFTTDDTLTSVSDYDQATITIDAYAIQADGFDSAAEAWAAQNGDFTNN